MTDINGNLDLDNTNLVASGVTNGLPPGPPPDETNSRGVISPASLSSLPQTIKDTFPLSTAISPDNIIKELDMLAKANGIKPSAILQMALTATSAALAGNCRFITSKYNNKKVPNIFSLLLLPVSTGKSQAQEFIDSPFETWYNLTKPKPLTKSKRAMLEKAQENVSSNFKTEYGKAFKNVFNAVDFSLDKAPNALDEVHNNPSIVKWQKLQQNIEALLSCEHKLKIKKQSDATGEDIANSSQDDGTAYISTSEFVEMLNILNGKYTKDNKHSLSAVIAGWLNEAFGQGRVNNDRKNARPNVVISALIQPSVWDKDVNKAPLLAQGFLQRFLIQYQTESLPQDEDVCVPVPETTEYHKLMMFIIGHFDTLTFSESLILPLTDEANAFHRKFESLVEGYETGHFGKWLDKSTFHVLKLATCFELLSMPADGRGGYVLPVELTSNSLLLAIGLWCKIHDQTMIIINACGKDTVKTAKEVKAKDGAYYPVPDVDITMEDFNSLLRLLEKPTETAIKQRKNIFNNPILRADFLAKVEEDDLISVFTDGKLKLYFPNDFRLIPTDKRELHLSSYFGLPYSESKQIVEAPKDSTVTITGDEWKFERFNKVSKKTERHSGKGFFSYFAKVHSITNCHKALAMWNEKIQKQEG